MKKENVKGIRLLDNISEVGLFKRLEMFITAKDQHAYEAKPTDLVILNGGMVDEKGFTIYWTSTTGYKAHAAISSTLYTKDKHFAVPKDASQPAIRPVLEVDQVPDVDRIAFGEYPQFVETNNSFVEKLNSEREDEVRKNDTASKKEGMVSKLTGKKWIIDGVEYPEYELYGNRYIGIVAKRDDQILSNGTKVVQDQVYWVRIDPILWRVDRDKKLLVSEYALLAGIRYWLNKEDSEYEKSHMKDVLEKEMLPNMIDCKEYNQEDVEQFDMEALSPILILQEYGADKIDKNFVEILKTMKQAVLNKSTSKETKKEIASLIARKKELAEMKPNEYKELLIQLLYYDFLSLDTFLGGEVKTDNTIKLFDEKVKTIIKIIMKKYSKKDFKGLTNYLATMLNKINAISKNDKDYINKTTNDRWKNGNRSVVDVLADVLYTDNAKGTEMKKVIKSYNISENPTDENDYLLSLDIDYSLSSGSLYNK